MTNRYNLLQLEKALNFRDLGGYLTIANVTVKKDVLFRSDALTNLTPEDISTIINKNIRTVIDLRTKFEIEQGENKLAHLEGVDYYNISLMDNVHSNEMNSLENTMPDSMGELYVSLLDNACSEIVAVFDIILNNSDYGTVFHCTAGKDRTGVIAALILDLLGVSFGDIIDNYIITEQLMEPIFTEMASKYENATGTIFPKYLFESRAESIEELLQHLYSKYFGAKSYLITNGFDQSKINRFKKAFLEEC